MRAQASRRHGSLENRRHGVLEVTCRADDRRLREATAARHVALLRQRALNRVGQDRSTQASLRAQRKKAAWDDSDRQHLLKVNFMREPCTHSQTFPDRSYRGLFRVGVKSNNPTQPIEYGRVIFSKFIYGQ